MIFQLKKTVAEKRLMIMISISQFMDSCINYMKEGGVQTMVYGRAIFFLQLTARRL